MDLIIAANWKMHKTMAEAVDYCRVLAEDEPMLAGVEVLICPPFTALSALTAVLMDTPFKLCAQNMHWERQGAFTGEISAPMLRELGVEYVIIGHSERRHLMGEDNHVVRAKIESAFKNGLSPILCVGETDDDREQGRTEIVLKQQLKDALADLSAVDLNRLVIAYEPVWAIGTGKAARPEDADIASRFIHGVVDELAATGTSGSLRIQYGGSVKAENIASYVQLDSVHGALVGGASLDPRSFSALIQAARKAVQD